MGAEAWAGVPVTLESRVDSRGFGEAVITNLKTVPLTAYLVQIFLEPCSPAQRPAVFRAADAALTPGGQPLSQFQSRTEPLGTSYCNKDGVSVPGRAELKAAIYQDGSFFGEPLWVNSLLENRRFQLEQLEIMLDRLKKRDVRNMPRQVLTADLEERLQVSQPKRRIPYPSPLNLPDLVRERFKAEEGVQLADQIARTVVLLEQLRRKLLEARLSPP
jgi:hypothetical protein